MSGAFPAASLGSQRPGGFGPLLCVVSAAEETRLPALPRYGALEKEPAARLSDGKAQSLQEATRLQTGYARFPDLMCRGSGSVRFAA
jgi:hypothetical protein